MKYYTQTAGGASTYRYLSEPGSILLIRSGAIIANYGDTRVTDADYGAGLMAAADAMTNGDELHVGPGTYEIDDLKFRNGSKLDGCRIFFNGSKVYVADDQDHTYSVYLYGDGNYIYGLWLDCNRTNRDSLTYVQRNEGIRIYGDKNVLDTCHVRNTPSNKDANGSYRHNFYVIGDDNLIVNCSSYDPGYSSFRNQGDRNTFRNIVSECVDSDAHVDFHHTGPAELLTVDGAVFRGNKGWLLDSGTTSPLRKAIFNNVHTYVTSDTNGDQPCKIADLNEFYATNCSFKHGKATYTPDSTANTQNSMKIGDVFERGYFSRCHWDSWISCSLLNASYQPDEIMFDECQFGNCYDGNICADATALAALTSNYEGKTAYVAEFGDWDYNVHRYDGSAWQLRSYVPAEAIYKGFARKLTFNRCRITVRSAVVTIDVSGLPSTANDVWTFTNNDIYLPDGSGSLIANTFNGTKTYSGNKGIDGTLTE